MDRLEFRTGSLTQERWRRIKSEAQASSSLPWTLPVAVLAAVALVAADAGGTGFARVRVNGTSVEGSRILLLRDDSESLDQHDTELKKQKAALDPIVRREVTMKGFGVITEGQYSDLNLLATATRELGNATDFDTVYVLSDFEPNTYGVDCDDRAGLLAFRGMIQRKRLRLYLSTVAMRPSDGLLAIARESGGDLIGLGSPADSSRRRAEVCVTSR